MKRLDLKALILLFTLKHIENGWGGHNPPCHIMSGEGKKKEKNCRYTFALADLLLSYCLCILMSLFTLIAGMVVVVVIVVGGCDCVICRWL